LKVIVYEHVSGGGYAEKPIPPDVLCEGFSMLRCVAEDFKAAGYEVTVLMDARLSKLNPPIEADCTVPIFYPQEPQKFLKSIAQINDAIYVIAPETGQTLQSFVELVEKTGKTSLNSTSEAISQVADKAVLYENLRKNGFSIPKTLPLNLADSLTQNKQAVKRELAYPVVVKPVDGVGCSGLSVVKEETQLEKAISKVKAESKTANFVTQEFINGESASVSLLYTSKKAMALSLNKQNVTLADPESKSSYDGGIVPLHYWLKQDVFRIAEKVAESFPGLRGYVGVDFVLTQHKAFVVDVNPRLTTSYVGLRRIAGFNVVEALVDAVVKGKLPSKHETRGYACFSKIKTPTPTVDVFQKTAKSAEVVSPPFPLTDNAASCALVIGEGSSLEVALQRLEEAKKHLLNIFT
jgi:predicted ATP-grasp superfamily ATP-dependent carboligase